MKKVSIEKILEILNTNITDADIKPEHAEEDLARLGMDSITFIRVVVALEEEFECEVPDSKLLMTEMNTVNKMFEVFKAIENGSIA